MTKLSRKLWFQVSIIMHRASRWHRFVFLITSIGFLLIFCTWKKQPSYRILPSNDIPLIFVGGVPRSGTTLMRAMLDAHPDIRCGQETHVIPKVLMSLQQMEAKIKPRLDSAGITTDVLDAALSAYILEIITKHDEPAPYLCNKDPLLLLSMLQLSRLFPKAKFILMLRDGRAVVDSLTKRRIGVGTFNLDDPAQCLQRWNVSLATMYVQCLALTSSRCMLVQYEKLVLEPEAETRMLFNFLGISWNEKVVHHEQYIEKGISISKKEPSTSQIRKAVYKDALTAWLDNMAEETVYNAKELAPLLTIFGYEPDRIPPDYGALLTKSWNFPERFAQWMTILVNTHDVAEAADQFNRLQMRD